MPSPRFAPHRRSWGTFTRLLLTALALCTALPSHGASRTYRVDRAIGAGSVSGELVTDGTLGLLQRSHILDWTLHLADGTGSVDFDSGNSHVFVASLTASPQALTFDLGAGNYLGFINDGVTVFNQTHWCLQGQAGQCTHQGSIGETVQIAGNAAAQQFVALGGMQVIATAVPEPTMLAMLAGGLCVGLLVLPRRRMHLRVLANASRRQRFASRPPATTAFTARPDTASVL